jgi:hypothetical protein
MTTRRTKPQLPDEPLFTVTALSNRWQVSRSHVLKLIRDGLLPAVNVAASDTRPYYRIPESVVRSYEMRNGS